MGVLARDLERLTAGIRALRIVRECIREGADVGKLSSIADRIRTTKANLDIEADKLAARLDDIDHAAPKAFDRGHAFLTAQASEVDEIEATLRELSNLDPNAPATSPRDSPAASPPDANAARRAAAGLAPLRAADPAVLSTKDGVVFVEDAATAMGMSQGDYAAFVKRAQQP